MSMKKQPNTEVEVNWENAWKTFWIKSPADWANTPCFRESALAGFGCAGLMMAHKLRIYKGQFRPAISAGILTLGFTWALSLGMCTAEREMRHGMIESAMKESKIKNARDAANNKR